MCRHSMPNNDPLTVYVDGFHVEETVVSDITAIVRRHRPLDQHRHILDLTECDIPREVCLVCKGARTKQLCFDADMGYCERDRERDRQREREREGGRERERERGERERERERERREGERKTQVQLELRLA